MSSRGPVYREGEEIVIELGDDAARIINGLIDELVAVVRSDDHELRDRLFPRASTDDEVASEYAHYMDRELVESRLESFDAFREVITDLPARIDEVQFNSVMHAINALRLVLGDVLSRKRHQPRRNARAEVSAPVGIRTPNLLIRSQMLYPLSYGR